MNKTILILIVVVIIAAGGVFLLTSSTNRPPSGEASQEIEKVEGYNGNVLAGSTSPFIEFNVADYNKAKKEGKVILLDFYASWCPICRAEAPEIDAGFNELDDPNIIGFRVNFNDPDTDSDEKALASDFKIPYQHTKVILKNGQEIFRSDDQWTKQDLFDAINNTQ